ncbi:MAG: ABC transporter substrate-binding protein, partial [Planctomycetota bacterium]
MSRWFVCVLIAFVAACGGDEKNRPYITLTSTTSARNSGLYAYLLPKFTEASGIDVRVVARGTGQAIRLARGGDADAILVHHKGYEEAFVEDGHGIRRLPIMYNEFLIVGPQDDPAGLREAKGSYEAFRRLAQAKALFVSRGDESGTHLRELALWKAAGIDPAPSSGEWYREAGTGMGATLNIAAGMGAYCLTDSGTWLAFKNKGDLKKLVGGDPPLFNYYTFIVVSKKRHTHAKQDLAQKLGDWLIGSEGQKAIADFR